MGVTFPAQLFAAVVVAFEQTLKVCGIAPPFVTVNVTAPWATVFDDSLNPNSDGLPAVTAIVAAARTGVACATGTATRTSAATADSRTRACLVMRLLPPGTGSGLLPRPRPVGTGSFAWSFVVGRR